VCYSFDFQSATDGWSLVLLFETMVCLFDRSFASSAVHSALGTNIFSFRLKRPGSSLSFVAGQPLGYHASWPLFALSHHILVWHCAEQVYPGLRFDKYAVLGDDVVIADEQVAKVYEQALGSLGFSISYLKSLLSHTGSAEFAKRFRVRDLSKDLSPISAQALLNSHHPYGTIAVQLQYPMRRFSTMCRVGGIGFRVLSRLDHSRSLRVERLLAMYTKTTLPIELWLGRCLPLNPYARGVIIELLRKELRPKELKLPPEELHLSSGTKSFLEWSVLRRWTRQWLQSVHWYWGVAMQPDVTIDQLFYAPAVITDYKISRKDPISGSHLLEFTTTLFQPPLQSPVH